MLFKFKKEIQNIKENGEPKLKKSMSEGTSGVSEVLDQYATSYPNTQNAIDIFKGEWSSEFPSECKEIIAGQAKLFEDDRVKWLINELNSVQGYNILELGPLEGGHAYMMEKAGANLIESVESNTRAYLKCLITKEILELKNVRFLCGDFNEYMKNCGKTFDLVIASGVLYHMKKPIELLYDISQLTDKVFIWTHYYDENIIKNNSNLAYKFEHEPLEENFNGRKYVLHKQDYLQALGWGGFCGGMNHSSYWLEKETIIQSLKDFGFTNIRIGADTPDHVNGPSFTLLAQK